MPDGTPVINAFFRQKAALENLIRAVRGLPPVNHMLLEAKVREPMGEKLTENGHVICDYVDESAAVKNGAHAEPAAAAVKNGSYGDPATVQNGAHGEPVKKQAKLNSAFNNNTIMNGH